MVECQWDRMIWKQRNKEWHSTDGELKQTDIELLLVVEKKTHKRRKKRRKTHNTASVNSDLKTDYIWTYSWLFKCRKAVMSLLVQVMSFKENPDIGPCRPVGDQLGPKQSKQWLWGCLLWIPDNRDQWRRSLLSLSGRSLLEMANGVLTSKASVAALAQYHLLFSLNWISWQLPWKHLHKWIWYGFRFMRFMVCIENDYTHELYNNSSGN